MSKLNLWVKAHPYQAMLFTNFFTLLAGCMAVVNDTGLKCGLMLFAVGIAVFAVTLGRGMKKLRE